MSKVKILITQPEAIMLREHLKDQPNPQTRPYSWSGILDAIEEGLDDWEPSDEEMGNEPDAFKGGIAENH